jgi:signal transduction histidine kinase
LPEAALNVSGWFFERIHPDDLERIERLFHSAFESRISHFSAECRLVHKDGHLVHAMLRATAKASMEEAKEIRRIEGIIVDITDRIFSEKAVVQNEKLRILNSISSEVAHEIRNPLMSIGGFARRLRKRFTELKEGDIILRESERLEKLLKRIAEYLKPVKVNFQKCSINSVLTESLDRFTTVEESFRSKYELNLAPDLEEITIDRELLSDVFLDLIRNASKEIEKDDKINIRTFGSDKNIYIESKNNCKIADSKDVDPFFLPFDEAGHEVTLPRSYRLLKNMGGLLSFSQGEKEMSFTVTLPKRNISVSEVDGALASQE